MGGSFELGNLLVRLNMGRAAKLKSVQVKYTSLNLEVISFLFELGLISNFKFDLGSISVYLKYVSDSCVFKNIVLVSKPGKKIFWNLINIAKAVENTSSIFLIISTSKGLMLASDCLWRGVGGVPLVKIYL